MVQEMEYVDIASILCENFTKMWEKSNRHIFTPFFHFVNAPRQLGHNDLQEDDPQTTNIVHETSTVREVPPSSIKHCAYDKFSCGPKE
jgi:hypothetical protein